MTKDHDDIRTLDDVFRAARDAPMEPSPELLARVLADAEAVGAALRPVRNQAGPPRADRLRDVFRALGGWPAMTGLAAATVAGIWIGLSPPAGLQAGLSAPDAAYIVDLAPGAVVDPAWEAL